jgi:hypothetical protein
MAEQLEWRHSGESRNPEEIKEKSEKRGKRSYN